MQVVGVLKVGKSDAGASLIILMEGNSVSPPLYDMTINDSFVCQTADGP